MSVDPLTIPNCAKGMGVVTATTLNVRSGPGTGYASLGKLPQGEVVTVWAAGGDWWIVQATDGITGWCSAAWLHAIEELRP